MLLKLLDNRVRRSYNSSGLIDSFAGKMPPCYPEDWIASVVTAYNPDFPYIENEGLSKLSGGEYLTAHVSAHPEALGTRSDISILVKFLDAGERLVIQCHPTDELAQKYFSSRYGKTECWYMVDVAPDAYVYLGFNETASREKWEQAFKIQDKALMLSMLHKLPVKKGDCIFVQGGVPHAIGEGCFMIELQQPSDLMVIPERTTLSGRVLNENKLHGGLGFDKMFDIFSYNTYTREEIERLFVIRHIKTPDTPIPVIDRTYTDKFLLDVLYVKASVTLDKIDTYSVLAVTSGSGTVSDGINEYKISAGDKFFVEAYTRVKICGDLSACILKP